MCYVGAKGGIFAFWISFAFVVLSVILQVLFQFAAVGRLTIPLIYFLTMAFICPKWAGEHETLTIGILIAMLAIVAISWVVTIVRKVREQFGR